MKPKSNTFLKIAVPIAIVWGIITIFQTGYAFGGWLFAFLH
jgi:hypothetical protein